MLTKLNYLIHTDAIKEYLLPIKLTNDQKDYVYASEADILNVALFGKRAKEWHDENPNKKGNIRDYTSTLELAILSNIEFQNAKLIEQGLDKKERLILLNKEANREKELFNKNKEKAIYRLENKNNWFSYGMINMWGVNNIDYRYEAKDEARDFHKQRIAFIILNNVVDYKFHNS